MPAPLRALLGHPQLTRLRQSRWFKPATRALAALLGVWALSWLSVPALVKSMSVQPPRGTGRIRTIRIGGEGDAPLLDLQPCGGTHVANTAEIGAIVVTKIEKKSATTRRVVLGFVP